VVELNLTAKILDVGLVLLVGREFFLVCGRRNRTIGGIFLNRAFEAAAGTEEFYFAGGKADLAGVAGFEDSICVEVQGCWVFKGKGELGNGGWGGGAQALEGRKGGAMQGMDGRSLTKRDCFSEKILMGIYVFYWY
jgi:hypothetical protein